MVLKFMLVLKSFLGFILDMGLHIVVQVALTSGLFPSVILELLKLLRGPGHSVDHLREIEAVLIAPKIIIELIRFHLRRGVYEVNPEGSPDLLINAVRYLKEFGNMVSKDRGRYATRDMLPDNGLTFVEVRGLGDWYYFFVFHRLRYLVQ